MTLAEKIPWQRRLQILCRLIWRDFVAKFAYIWIYALTSALLGIAAAFVQEFQHSFDTETVIVAADPIAPAHGIVFAICSLAFGLRAATAIAWEREHRTMEVLLAGPVTTSSFVLSKLLSELLAYFVVLLAYAGFVLIVHPAGQFGPAWASALKIAVLALYGAPVICLGILASSLLPTVKSATMLYALLVIVLAFPEGLNAWLAPQNPNDLSLMSMFALNLAQRLSAVLTWGSPVSFLSAAIRETAGTFMFPPGYAFAAVVCSMALAFLSVATARKRGAT